jgi:hypothetical protein
VPIDFLDVVDSGGLREKFNRQVCLLNTSKPRAGKWGPAGEGAVDSAGFAPIQFNRNALIDGRGNFETLILRILNQDAAPGHTAPAIDGRTA